MTYGSTRPAASQSRQRVLLVDDDEVSLELTGLLLAHEGFDVQRAHDAGSALQLLATEASPRPDVMLVDLQMPGISGRDLAESVRALGKPNPLLLAMSATKAQRQQLLAFDGFLLKPLAVEELRKALETKGEMPAAQPRIRRVEPADGAAPLDYTVVGKLLTMMPAQALGDVVSACIADTRSCIDELRTQVRRGDTIAISQSAHRIKGAAMMIGATRLAGIAGALEKGGGKEAATPAVLTDLLSACTELEGMLLAGKFKIA